MRGQKMYPPQAVTEPAGDDEMPMPLRKRMPAKKQMRPMPKPMPTRPLTPQDVPEPVSPMGMKKGGMTKAYAKGGVTRADGCAQRGHTKGRYI
jgi:hypothetical protein